MRRHGGKKFHKTFHVRFGNRLIGFINGNPFTTVVNADRTTAIVSSAVVAISRRDLAIIETENKGVAFYSDNNHTYYYWKDYGKTWKNVRKVIKKYA